MSRAMDGYLSQWENLRANDTGTGFPAWEADRVSDRHEGAGPGAEPVMAYHADAASPWVS